MKDIITVLKLINDNPLRVYIGEGMIDNLTVSLHSEQLPNNNVNLLKKLPKQYLEFLQFSNGLEFYNSGDHRFHPLDEVLALQKSYGFNENVFPIGYFLEDTVLLVLDQSTRGYSIYVGSNLLLDEFILLEHDFKEFLENLLIHNCSNFWIHFNDENYYDFS